jgi:hypothetical protein
MVGGGATRTAGNLVVTIGKALKVAVLLLNLPQATGPLTGRFLFADKNSWRTLEQR